MSYYVGKDARVSLRLEDASPEDVLMGFPLRLVAAGGRVYALCTDMEEVQRIIAGLNHDISNG